MANRNRLEYEGLSHQPRSEPSLAEFTAAHAGTTRTSQWDDLTREQKRHVRHHFLVTVGATDSEAPGAGLSRNPAVRYCVR